MVSQTQCRAYAENYKRLAVVSKISIQRATVLMAISRSWITLPVNSIASRPLRRKRS